MSDFKERLIQEQDQLLDKISKLDDFIGGERFAGIDEMQKSLLKVQLNAMQTYNQCLTERINALSIIGG